MNERMNPVGWRMYPYVLLFALAGTFYAYPERGLCSSRATLMGRVEIFRNRLKPPHGEHQSRSTSGRMPGVLPRSLAYSG